MRLIPKLCTSLLILFSQAGITAELANSNIPTDGHFSMSVGVSYDTGDYGSAVDTDVWVTPIGLKYRKGLWSFGLSTSWLHIKSPNIVDAEGDFIGGGGARTTEQGMGDTFLSASYDLLDDRDYLIGLDVKGNIKIPTADEDKFLGSGKTDYGLNLEAYKTFNNWTPYWNVGYKWKGDPSGINYNNVWSTGLGFDYKVNRDLILGAEYFWQQKTTKFSENAKELTVSANYYVNDNNKLNFFLLTGFGNASPNWGSGVTLVHYF
jgi:Putative MetA-pathway of phenol degradation